MTAEISHSHKSAREVIIYHTLVASIVWVQTYAVCTDHSAPILLLTGSEVN